jgi:hypothetical protein
VVLRCYPPQKNHLGGTRGPPVPSGGSRKIDEKGMSTPNYYFKRVCRLGMMISSIPKMNKYIDVHNPSKCTPSRETLVLEETF